MDDEAMELLREAVRLLRLLARPQLTELRERFESAMLSSSKRRQMWELMDGTRSLPDIAGKVKTTSEAVRQFVVEAEAKWPDLIVLNRTAAGTYPRRLV